MISWAEHFRANPWATVIELSVKGPLREESKFITREQALAEQPQTKAGPSDHIPEPGKMGDA